MSAAARAASVAPGYGDAAVRFFQGGGVVDPVAGHPDDVAALLQYVDDVVFVLGEDLGETVCGLDGFGYRRRFVLLRIAQGCGVEDVGAQADFGGGFLRDGQGVAGHHLDGDAHRRGGGDGRCRVVAGRVEQRQHADELPVAVPVGAGHAQRPEAAGGEIVDCLIGGRFDLRGVARPVPG